MIPMNTPCVLYPVSEHVWWYSPDARTDRPALGAVVGEHGTLMLDVGASPAHTAGFLKALADAGLPPPRYAALTHWHWDHSFGGAALNVPIIAHTQTAHQLAIQAGYAWDDAALDARVEDGREIAFCAEHIKLEMPSREGLTIRLPDVLFEQHLVIDLGDVQCELYHVGGDHAADSSVIYVRNDRVLFMGDCLYAGIYTPQRQYTVTNTRALLGHLHALDVEHYILGHHEQVMQHEVSAWMRGLQVVSDLVAQHGANREAIIADYQTLMGTPPDEDTLEDIGYFVAGVATGD